MQAAPKTGWNPWTPLFWQTCSAGPRPWPMCAALAGAQQEPGGAEALRTALAGAGETLLATENSSSVSAVSAPSGMFEAFRQAAMEGRSARLRPPVSQTAGRYSCQLLPAGRPRLLRTGKSWNMTGRRCAPAGRADGHRKLAFYRKGQSAFELAPPLHEDGHSMLRASPCRRPFKAPPPST